MAADLFPLLLLFLGSRRGDSGPSIVVPPPTPGPAPGPSPAPSPTVPPTPAPPTPSDIVVPRPTSPGEPSAGMRKAVEVWEINPSVVSNRAVVGALAPEQEAAFVDQLQTTFPVGWRPRARAAPEETELAQRLLANWEKGKLLFVGPKTLQGRRVFRMTEHPRPGAPAPSPAPSPAPPAPAPPAPAPAPPAPAPPAPPAPAPAPPAPPTPAPAGPLQVTSVRPNEGLIHVARRALGTVPQHEEMQRANELRRANVPTGPDGVTWELKDLRGPEQGIKKKNRKGGLQPNDRLFLPASWGRVDPARL